MRNPLSHAPYLASLPALLLIAYLFNPSLAFWRHSGSVLEPTLETTSASCTHPDYVGLMELYNQTDGPNWTNNSGWADGAACINCDPCTWFGVACDGSGRVTNLVLENNGLNGTIPDFAVPFLERVELGFNQLSGGVPDFSNTPNLFRFRAASNNLTGTLPDFTNLPLLQIFSVSFNNLSGTIPDYSSVPLLRELSVNNNQLTGGIPDFTNLPDLRRLEVGFNQLTGGIPDFSNTPLMVRFQCMSNNLTGSITDFSNMPLLEIFHCGINQLTGMIPDFSNTPVLRELYVSENQLTGPIPDLSDITTLDRFFCNDNNLDCFYPDFICNLSVFSSVNNPMMPWQGAHANFCAGLDQIGAPCDDGDPVTFDDEIQADCSCQGQVPCTITIDLDGTDLTCNGDNSGTIDLTINDGLAPFDIDWNDDTYDGQSMLTGLSANTFSVTVTDALGCPASGTITLNEPTAIQLNCLEQSPATTVGGSDGVGSISASGGTSPYSATYSGPVSGSTPTFAANQFISNLPAGNYTVVVTDANGCMETCNFDITEPVCTMTLGLVANDLSCFSAGDGSINLTINNGTSPFTIDWNDDNFDGQSVLNGLSPGTYSVTVTDAVNCTASGSVDVDQPDAIQLVCAELSAVTTVGGSDGIGNISAMGGTPPYTATYTGPVNGSTPSFGAAQDVDNLPAGIYSITVEDANGCTESCTFEITKPVCTMTIDLTANELTCSDAADGSISVAINNGTEPYQFDWDDDSYDGLSVLTNLEPGTFQVTVTDAVGCQASGSTTVNSPAPLQLDCAEGSPVTVVGGSDGIGTISAIGGTAPYTATYSGPVSGTTAAFNDDQTVENLPAGFYTVVVTDANACTATCSFDISEPFCAVSLDITTTDQSCSDSDDGTISLSINNGTAPFTIDWDDDIYDGLTDLTGLAAGDYSVTVTDAVGCQAIGTTTVNSPAPIMTTCNEDSPVSAFGGMDGVGIINVSGGTAPYSATYVGPVSGMTTSFTLDQTIENLAAGIYDVTITDANGCVATCSFEITEPPCALTTDLTMTDVSCPMGNDGSIDLSIMNGTPPYTIDWNDDTYDGLNMLTELSAGTYSVVITDALGCSTTNSATINEPAALQITCSEQSPATTVGGTNGVGSIELSGGTAPYTGTYTGPISGSIAAFTANQLINGLSAGSYQIDIVDTNGCPISCTLQITEPVCTIGLNLTGANPSCANTADGSIDLEIINGQAPLNINWDNDTYDGQTNLTGLSAGTYLVTVTDAVGCSDMGSITLSAPAALQLTCTEDSPVTTVGGSDGVAQITASGGTPPYTATYSGPASGSSPTFSNDILLNNLMAGLYDVVLTDANGCMQTCSFVITDPSCIMSLNLSATNLSCFNAADGTIELVISDGTAPFTIDWNNDNYDNLTSLTGLSGGTYSVIVTDALGCSAAGSAVVVEPDMLEISCAETSPVTTVGGTDGIATITASGGTAPYTASYSGPMSGTTSSFSGTQILDNLSAGTYMITITDANGCTQDCSLEITEPSCSIMLDLSATALTCFESADGSIELNIANGTPPYVIDWNDDAYDGQASLNGLMAGTYAVNVTDAVGCTQSESIEVSQPSALTIVCEEDTPVSTSGGMDGIGSISVSGGTGPYTGSYSGPLNGAIPSFTGSFVIPNLIAGVYDVTVLDASGCPASCSFVITDPSCNLSLSLSSSDLSCAGAGDGSISLVIQNGTDPLTIDWSDDAFDGQTFLNGLSSGDYSVTVTDAVGCVALETVTVNEPEALTLMCGELTPVSTVGGADGIGSLSVSGGTSPYVATFTGPVIGEITAFSSDLQINSLPAGTYAVIVTDINGCAEICSFEITEPDCQMSIGLDVTSISCFGADDGSIELDIFNGTPPYTISWNDPAFDGETLLNNLSPGPYSVTVVDAQGCSLELQTNLTEPSAIEITTSILAPTCPGDTDGQIIIDDIQGGLPPYEASLDGVFFEEINLPFSYTELAGGNYNLIVQDANDCATSIDLALPGDTPLSIELGPDQEIKLGDSLQLNPITNFSVESFIWESSSTLSIPTIFNATVRPLETTTYTLTVFDENGCSASDEITISVNRSEEVYVPNAFSPNRDGTNDVFRVFAGSSVQEIKDFQVYDRWGSQLFQQGPFAPNDFNAGWDGTSRGEELQAGVYLYFVEVVFIDGREAVFSGDVVLVR